MSNCKTEKKKKILINRKAAALLHSRSGCINKANKLIKALTPTLSSIASDRPDLPKTLLPAHRWIMPGGVEVYRMRSLETQKQIGHMAISAR